MDFSIVKNGNEELLALVGLKPKDLVIVMPETLEDDGIVGVLSENDPWRGIACIPLNLLIMSGATRRKLQAERLSRKIN
ncbi:MAG TPA: hypothetical protein PKI61_04330 [bacterium]|nr:hypothetical protein [bacterium]HPT29820.1 hypothetical protein [bacterium]